MNARIALDFIRAINEHDLERLCSLMTDDHAFVDSQDNKVIGREEMCRVWKEYFSWFPDYHIEINDVLEKQDVVVITGFANGTWKNLKSEVKDSSFIVPAAFKVIIKDSKVELWQVFADASRMMEVVKRNTTIPETDLSE
jgi:ketosteroid isomerase-like protein